MASHLLLYRKLDDRKPVACADPNARVRAVPLDAMWTVRLLTGRCPLCGVGVSMLSGRDDHPRWEVA